MKTLITDYTFEDVEIERGIIEPAGSTVRAGQFKTPAALTSEVADADFVITQFAPVNADVIAAMQRAKIIVRYGIGVDNVDLAAAAARRIPVCNVPDYCIDEVADHTLAFILACTRQIIPNAAHVSDGKWGLACPLTAMRSLANSTAGVIGFGRIGREVVSRLRPFRCDILVFDPVVDDDEIRAVGGQPATLDALLSRSDIVTLHCPANEHTHHLINGDSIAQMKPGVVLVNCSRGALVNSSCLAEALQSGRVAAAALDVTEVEPLPADSPLHQAPNLVIHSHIASASPQSVRSLREGVAHLVVQAIRQEPLENVVNRHLMEETEESSAG